MAVFRTLLIHLWFALTLLYSQGSATVHASIHDFHEHDEACEVFQALERAADTVTSDVAIGLQPTLNRYFVFSQESLCYAAVPIAKCRSPPTPLFA